ncbi:MAG: vWA domain-containing protein [Oscillospiraceae bacterium]
MKTLLSGFLTLLMMLIALPTTLFAAQPAAPLNSNSHESVPVLVGGTTAQDYPDSNQQGFVSMKKSAQWSDKAAGTAEVNFEVFGVPTSIDVLIVLDRSGSMDKVVPNSTTVCGGTVENGICRKCGKSWSGMPIQFCTDTDRLAIAQAAAVQFVNYIFAPDISGNASNSRVGLVTFCGLSGDPNVDKTLKITSHTQFFNAVDKSGLISAINTLEHRGGTDYTSALTDAKTLINGRADTTRPVFIVFLTDGLPAPNQDGIAVSAELKAMGTKIYSIALAIDDTDPWNKAAKPLLRDKIAYSPTCYYDVFNPNDAHVAFQEIALAIKSAGTNAVLTDIVNSADFTIDTARQISVNGAPPAAGRVTVVNNRVDWKIGNILQEKSTITIPIRLDPNKNGSFPTNEGRATLSYTNFLGNTRCVRDVATPVLSKDDAKYSVTYNASPPPGTVATGTVPVDSKAYSVGDKVTVLPHGTLAVTGYRFAGWQSGNGISQAGDLVTVAGNITFSAVWAKDDSATLSYTVKYFKNGTDMNADIKGTVWKGNPIVGAASVSYSNMPSGHELDTAKSTQLPFTVTIERNIIEVHYKAIPPILPTTALTISHYYYTDGILDGSMLNISPGFAVGSQISFGSLTHTVWNGITYNLPNLIDIEKTTPNTPPIIPPAAATSTTRITLKPGEKFTYEEGSSYSVVIRYSRTAPPITHPSRDIPQTGDRSVILGVCFALLSIASAGAIVILSKKIRKQ